MPSGEAMAGHAGENRVIAKRQLSLLGKRFLSRLVTKFFLTSGSPAAGAYAARKESLLPASYPSIPRTLLPLLFVTVRMIVADSAYARTVAGPAG